MGSKSKELVSISSIDDLLQDIESLTNMVPGVLKSLIIRFSLCSDIKAKLGDLTQDVQSFTSAWLPPEVLLTVWDDAEDSLENLDAFGEVLVNLGDGLVLRSGQVSDVETALEEWLESVDGFEGLSLPFEVHLLVVSWNGLNDVLKDIESNWRVLISKGDSLTIRIDVTSHIESHLGDLIKDGDHSISGFSPIRMVIGTLLFLLLFLWLFLLEGLLKHHVEEVFLRGSSTEDGGWDSESGFDESSDLHVLFIFGTTESTKDGLRNSKRSLNQTSNLHVLLTSSRTTKGTEDTHWDLQSTTDEGGKLHILLFLTATKDTEDTHWDTHG